MFENDWGSTGNFTVNDLRQRLRRIPGDTVVCLAVSGWFPTAITSVEYEKPESPEEGEIGTVYLGIDPDSPIAIKLEGTATK